MGCDTLRSWAMGGSMGSTSATNSDAGVKQWGQLVFGYNAATERIDIQYVRVHKAAGVTVTAPADAARFAARTALRAMSSSVWLEPRANSSMAPR